MLLNYYTWDVFFFFSSRRRHTRCLSDWSSDVCSSDLRHFGISRTDVIAHSYMGVMVGVYAMKYPAHVNRVVQIGPMQPNAAKQYPAHLTEIGRASCRERV